ncbi:uncharacterized protein [Drosophila virilis]|uniref:Protein TsetseEP domain-containing protein n=1 Tax=Drosophila virilis TaxID=7244 RepID=B4M5M4_DROVI|nr:uncharacterized protein LOC6632544 [Drosophila virilis]EDW58950.1 uncharacterized protein Dvir_GJ10551 [Drosophila virilis]
MFLKISVLLLGLSISYTLARRLPLSLTTNEKIQKLHSESLVLAEVHQDTSTICFSYYNPKLNLITVQYEVDYDSCISAYETSSKQVENCYKSARESIETSAFQSCSALYACNLASNAYNAFECASITAAEDAKIFYAISANATDAAIKSKSDYSRVDTTRNVCVSNAEKNYVENTSKVYGLLNSCLLGNDNIPVSTESTTTDFTDWSTYDE